jgi:hypothetical protein
MDLGDKENIFNLNISDIGVRGVSVEIPEPKEEGRTVGKNKKPSEKRKAKFLDIPSFNTPMTTKRVEKKKTNE